MDIQKVKNEQDFLQLFNSQSLKYSFIRTKKHNTHSFYCAKGTNANT